MDRIAMIIPYFGPFPEWINYFFTSCKYNPDIDFYIFTDNEPPPNIANNIKFTTLSFTAYKTLVSHRLALDFCPTHAYKLCDIKPALGAIHVDIIKNYDFWGFCDIDLVFGHIRHFITSDMLASYNFISTLERRVSGHFFLVRNNPDCNWAFSQVRGWRSLFADPQHCYFDEKAFSKLFIGFKNYPKAIQPWLQKNFIALRRQAYFKEQFSTPSLRYPWTDGTHQHPTQWFWNKGILTNNRDRRTFLYFHFLLWKRAWRERPAQFSPLHTHHWSIDKNGFWCHPPSPLIPTQHQDHALTLSD